MKNQMMKKITKIVTVATVSAMVMGTCVGCGSSADVANTDTEEAVAEDTEVAEATNYEFETFDGAKVVINESNIVSKEECEEPLEWTGLPADAEQLAPGRDCILFGDSANYYVEDATNKLVVVAMKEQGDVIEESDVTIFDNDVFSFAYDPAKFTVNESEEGVTVSFYDESIQTAGANTITFTKQENADAMQVVKSYMELYGASEDEMAENYLGGDDVKGYTYSTGVLGAEDSELKTCDTYYVVPCGDDVIVINSLRTYGSDMDVENSIDEQFGNLILTFQLD